MPNDLITLIRNFGGAMKTCELRRCGASKNHLAWAVRTGLLHRPRKGWYVEPSTPDIIERAVRVGGRATCLTALRLHGVWVTEREGRPHVAVHRSATELRSARDTRVRQARRRDAVVHWVDTPKPREVEGSRLIEPPTRALLHAAGECLRGDALAATIESMLHLGMLDDESWQRIRSGFPATLRDELGVVGDRSESGVESYFVRGMRRVGVEVRQQVWLGRDRIDGLIGDCLAVELDGERHHEPHRDRVRDARLITAGMRAVLHFDYAQVLGDWLSVEATVLAYIARGDHLRR